MGADSRELSSAVNFYIIDDKMSEEHQLSVLKDVKDPCDFVKNAISSLERAIESKKEREAMHAEHVEQEIAREAERCALCEKYGDEIGEIVHRYRW